MERFFNLQENERIVQEIKPLPSLRWYFFFGLDAFAINLIIWFGVFLYVMIRVANFFELLRIVFIYLGLAILVGIIINFIYASLKYGKQYYWITNKRVIYKRGIIGYRITSIPYERISDVIISRTFFERLFGFGSLHIQSLAGQVSGTGSLGAEGVLLAVPNPEGIQEVIFKLAKVKRREEGLTI